MRNRHFVYRINDIETNRLIYIGQTGNIFNRASGHEHMNKDRRVSFVEVRSKKDRIRIEAVFLFIFKPTENVKIPSENPLLPENYNMSSLTDWIDLDTFTFKNDIPKIRGEKRFSADNETGDEWKDDAQLDYGVI
jgi:hypothetical protein